MSGNQLAVLAHQKGIGEAELDNAFCDLADLLGRMRPRIPRIELDLADRHVLDAHAVSLALEIRRAIPVSHNALQMRQIED
jgi:hypothetical protein